MKGAPLRIDRHGDGPSGTTEGALAKVAEAVTKLIPGEVVAAYLAGKAALQASTPPKSIGWWIGWTVFCGAAVFVLRTWMTSDTDARVPPEWSAVVVSVLSFLIWVYSFGDVFQMLGLWDKVGSALLLLAWTLFAPVLLVALKKRMS